MAELQSHVNWIDQRLKSSQDHLTDIRHELRDTLTPDRSSTGAVQFSDVRMQAGATLHAQLRLQTLAIEMAGVMKRLERAREDLKDAAARRKAVELLIERRREEARRAADRRESAELDEISTVRHSRADIDRLEAAS